jgi:hypothetical protein
MSSPIRSMSSVLICSLLSAPDLWARGKLPFGRLVTVLPPAVGPPATRSQVDERIRQRHATDEWIEAAKTIK